VNRAVLKTLTVLEHLLAHKSGRTLTQLAEDLTLPVSSVNDVAKTLVKLGYLRYHSESRRYHLTLKLMDLGQTYLQRMPLYTLCAPLLGQLSKRLDCVAAVYQFYREARKLVLIAEAGTAPHLRFGWEVGDAVLHCCAPGKVVLASLSDDEVAEILRVIGMPQLTPHTITNQSALQRELLEGKKRGYALDREEVFLGIGCIAIPVKVHGSIIAALTIRTLIDRLEPEFISRSVEVLSTTAAALANGVSRAGLGTT
jgi:IclR family transcriptional regulator, KDG regulon repressor